MNQQLNQVCSQFIRSLIEFLVSFERIYFQLPPPVYDNLIDIENNNTNWDNISEISQQFEQDSEYITINEYLQNHQDINQQEFFSRVNDIRNIEMTHDYEYPLNKGTCWNCSNEYTHQCCAACKKMVSQCDCQFICGFTFPTGQKNKNGEYCQFTKCKYYTNDINNLLHDCLGKTKNDDIILFIDKKDIRDFKLHNVNRDKKCYRCNKPGHNTLECKDYYCYKCKQKGHIAKDCVINYNHSTGWDY